MPKKLSYGSKMLLFMLFVNILGGFIVNTVGGLSSPAFWGFFIINLAVSFFLSQMMKMWGDERTQKIHEKSLRLAFEAFGVSLLTINYVLAMAGLFVGEVATFMWGMMVAFLVVIALYTVLYIYQYKNI